MNNKEYRGCDAEANELKHWSDGQWDSVITVQTEHVPRMQMPMRTEDMTEEREH